MSLLLPLALLGLLTLPLIIILHLLRNRRQLLPISSLRLWRGLQQKRQGALPRHIPLSLMLLLQLLVAAGLTFGLAQPAFSFLRHQPQHLIFVLDTTTSMLAEDARPADMPQFISENTALGNLSRRFELARQALQTELDALQPQDTFAVINLNRHPEILLQGDGSQKAQARLTLDNLIPAGTGLDLPAALTLANGLLASDRPNRIIVLTDNSYVIDPATLPAVLAPLTWQSFGAGPSAADLPVFANQALLNVSSRRLPDGRHRVFARVVNYGSATVERTLRLSADGSPVEDVTIQLEPQAETARVWTLSAEAETATVEIVEPDVLPADNQAELLLFNTIRHQVLLLTKQTGTGEGEQNQALRRALAAQPGVDLSVVDLASWNSQIFENYDLLVFEGWPADLTDWPRGNILLIDPPLGHPRLTIDNFVRNLRPDLETVSPLLAGVDLSGVYFTRLPAVQVPEWATVEVQAVPTAPNNSPPTPLIFQGDVGDSRVVVWAFALDQSNLPARLALPLLTGNTLASLISTGPAAVVPLGEPVELASNVTVEVPGGGRLSPASPPLGQGDPFERTKQPGLYRLYSRNATPLGGFAVHAGSALESNVAAQFDSGQLVELDTGSAEAIPVTEFYEFWPWLAAVAVVLMTVEGWLAWRT